MCGSSWVEPVKTVFNDRGGTEGGLVLLETGLELGELGRSELGVGCWISGFRHGIEGSHLTPHRHPRSSRTWFVRAFIRA
jgi:hypothetical protein